MSPLLEVERVASCRYVHPDYGTVTRGEIVRMVFADGTESFDAKVRTEGGSSTFNVFRSAEEAEPHVTRWVRDFNPPAPPD